MEQGDLIFEDDGEFIKAASVEQLINHCLKCFEGQTIVNANAAKFVKVFFITYNWFITGDNLLRGFLRRITDSKHDLSTLTQVYYAVKYWISNYGSDFENNEVMLSALGELNIVIQANLNNGAVFSLDLEEWSANHSKSLKTGTLSRKQSLNFNDMSSYDFANQLHYLIFKGIRKIPIEECKNYGKSASALECPILRDQISLFNDISKYVIAMVLSHGTPELRAKSIHKFVDMAKQLLKLNDFNAVMAVVGGLGHSALLRLNKTKELLSPEDKLFIKETQELLSSDQNYVKYRSMADQVQGFLIPVLGVVMKDLVALETAVGDMIKDGDLQLVNFRKMTQLSSILDQLLKSKKLQPEMNPKNHLLHIIRVSLKSRYTEDDLYEMSMQREPREAKSSVSKAHSLSTSSFLFADWASGVIDELPNRDTVEKHVQAMVNAVFNTYDLDKNGSINEEEFDALATNFPFIDKFAVLDVNCDGNISRQEMLNYFMNVNAQEMTKEFLHDFQEHGFYSPHYCVYCMGFLWGIGKSGFRCKNCHITCHRDCKSHVVMECKPVRQSQSMKGTFDYPDAKFKSKSLPFKKRFKPIDEDWRGSSDSQISYADSELMPSDSSDVIVNGSPTIRRHDMRIRDRVLKLEMEKDALMKENYRLKSKLSNAEETISELQAQLGQVRQQSVTFVMEQVARLNTSKETEV